MAGENGVPLLGDLVNDTSVRTSSTRSSQTDMPSLWRLLENTFDFDISDDQECPPLKRSKLIQLGSPTSGNKLGVIGISNEEFKSDPCILIAVRRLLDILKNMLIRRSQLTISERDRNYQQLQEDTSNSEEGVEFQTGEIELLNRSLKEVDLLFSYIWEQLNVGHWKAVPKFWRKLYTCLTILKVAFMVIKSCSKLEIIKNCDMGLIMGEPICDNALNIITEELSATIIEEREDITMPGGIKITDDDSACRPSYENFPLKNKSTNEQKLTRFHQPSLVEFFSCMETSTPCLLLNIADDWPAMSKWNVSYIEKVAGFRTVPTEIGDKYTSEDWTMKVMTISEFIERFMKTSHSHMPSTNTEKNIGYIAQVNLFDQIATLKQDIKIPIYCSLGEDPDDVEINAWFGPAHTISSCHYDPKHNILVQVFGSKVVRLFPPDASSSLLPYPETTLLFNTSQLDIEQDDLFERYPKMKTEMHYDTVLEAGQALYIPPGWWHYVKSLTPSFSVSFWYR